MQIRIPYFYFESHKFTETVPKFRRRIDWIGTGLYFRDYSDYIEFPHDVLSYDNFYIIEETKIVFKRPKKRGTVMPRSSDIFSTLTHFCGGNEFFFIVLKLLIYAWQLVLLVKIIKNDDLRPLVHFLKKKPHCPNLGSMFQSSDSTYICLSFYGVYFTDPKFGHWQGFKKNLKVQDKPADE